MLHRFALGLCAAMFLVGCTAHLDDPVAPSDSDARLLRLAPEPGDVDTLQTGIGEDSPFDPDDLLIRGGAALPRDFVDTRATPVTGRTITVRAGDNLQAALNGASRGDEVVLDAGATFIGTFTLPAKAGSPATGWITVRSSAVSSLPTPGRRIAPADSVYMPRLQTSGAGAVLQTAAGASGWRLIGIELTMSPTANAVNNGLVLLGDGSSAQVDAAQIPSHLILDRVFVHGYADAQTKRCVGLNSARTAIIDSYISMCHGKGFDSQAIGGWNGPGPYKIQNNRLEGAGENIMFGGADPAVPNLIPSDIEIRGNYIYKPRDWQRRSTVKNLFELKNAQRVLVDGNVLRNTWTDAQVGFAFVLGSVNQSGRCGWCIVQDVTIRYNVVDSVGGGFNIFEGYAGSQWLRRLTVAHNLLTNVGQAELGGLGRMFQISGHVHDLTIEHNTGFAPYMYLMFGDGTPVIKDRFVFRNNVGGNAQYNLHSSTGLGASALTRNLTAGYIFSGNVIVGSASGMPTGNSYAANLDAVGFIDRLAGDWTLGAASVYTNGGTNGRTPGADMSVLVRLKVAAESP